MVKNFGNFAYLYVSCHRLDLWVLTMHDEHLRVGTDLWVIPARNLSLNQSNCRILWGTAGISTINGS